MGRIYWSLIITLLVCRVTVAQDVPLYFQHLTKNDGLSSNRVNAIFEDSQGFVWFGTEDGLNKFDGYSFEVFRNNPEDSLSIVGNAIVSIVEDPATMNLIIATKRGLVLYDRALDRFNLLFKKELELSPDQNFDITSMVIPTKNHLLVGTRHGLFHFNLDPQKLLKVYNTETSSRLTNNIIFELYSGLDGKVWIGHQEGVNILDVSSGKIRSFQPHVEMTEVFSIFEDSTTGAWIGSNTSGLYHFPDLFKDEFKHYHIGSGHFNGNRVHGIRKRSDHSYLIIVRDDGLYELNPKSGKISYYGPDIYDNRSINSKAVISISKSSQGFFWIGTYNSGINYIDNHRKLFEHYRVDFKETGLFNNNVRALYEDSEGYIWIGTKEGGGLSRFDRQSMRFVNYQKSDDPEGLTDDYIFSIKELNRDQLLLGTIREGLAIFEKRTGKFRYFKNDPTSPTSIANNRVYVIHPDPQQGQVYVGTDRELQLFDPESGEFSTIEGILNPKCIIPENERQLWIGTRRFGLFLYDKEKGIIKNYRFDPQKKNTISDNDVFALNRDLTGALWVGTKRGLCMLDKEKDTFKRFFENDGLSSNWVCGIETDNQNNIWISTVNGLSKFNYRTKEFSKYDIGDGLQSNEFEPYVSLKTSDGSILFGGRNGFNMFLPENITDNIEKPAIVITGFKLFNKKVPVASPGSPLSKDISQTTSLDLKYNQSAITFDYTALNYSSPEKNQYAYILHGFDIEWIQAGTNRNAVYTNIPPGSYTFQVVGSNNDGYWNLEGASIDLNIAPPPWKTGFAYAMYMIILLGMLFLIRRILIYRIEQRKMIEFERKDKERIQELNQMKLRFFTNISHEFRTPLTLISGPLEKLMSYREENDERRYLLNIMQNNVRRMLMLINELMDFRKAEQENLKLHISRHDPVKFVNGIIECFQDHALSININITFEHELGDIHEFWFDSAIIDKVIFNLLSNALKYNSPGGKINIEMYPENGKLFIAVSDSGKGISQENLQAIFDRFYRVEEKEQLHLSGTGIGLAFSKRLLMSHKGEIEVESLVNIGSKFTIHFPYDKNRYASAVHIGHEDADRSYLMQVPGGEKKEISFPPKAGDETARNEKIMIVEDDEEMRAYLASTFSDYRVYTADQGKSGYFLALKEVPDLIISDVMMPEMDGIEMCTKLKKQMATSHIPIIILSAKSEVAHKIEGIETGADSYIEKPYETEYLKAIANNLLKQRANLRKRFASEPEINLAELQLTSHEKKFIEKSRSIIEKSIENPDFSVENLGMELGLSRSQLFRKFRTLYDAKPSDVIRAERLKKAKKLLETRENNINEVAYKIGFKSSSHFITSFKKYYGETPNEYFNRITGR